MDYAIAHRARIFAHLGDLFDTQTPSNRDRAFVAEALERLRQAGIVCVAIGGNHDTPRMQTEQGGAGPQWVYAALGGLRFFGAHDALRPILLEANGLRVAVAGLTNNPVAPPGSDPLERVRVDDPNGLLAQADVGLLLLHAAIEGMSMPNEGERTVAIASLDTLDPRFNVVAAGHIHRFGRQRIDAREVIVAGSTEVMEFGAHAGGAGFVWLELARDGARNIQHIHLDAQPRADIALSTVNLWPENRAFLSGMSGTLSGRDAALLQTPPAATPLETILGAMAICTPETITRLRLYGPLSREQYHLLPIRQLLHIGQKRTFSLDLDTRELYLYDPNSDEPAPMTGIGPISLLDELDALVAARRQSMTTVADTDDLDAAARLLRERIAAEEGERGQ